MSDTGKTFLKTGILFAASWVVIIWSVQLMSFFSGVDLYFLGILPRSFHGLAGIVFSPMVHGDFAHITNNTFPLFFLTVGLFFLYERLALRVFWGVYVLTGIAVWLMAGAGWHIGASGIIYGLASFLFFSGVFRKDIRSSAVSFVIILMYGSMIWGVLPFQVGVSWESHLFGGVSGMLLAYFYREIRIGPEPQKYEWELESEVIAPQGIEIWDYEKLFPPEDLQKYPSSNEDDLPR